MAIELLTTGFYVNPKTIMAIGIVFPVLSIIVVSARFYARLRNNLGLGIDDWLCVPALLFLSAVGAIYIYAGAEEILGARLPPDVTFPELLADPDFNYARFLQVEFYSNFFSNLSTGMIRLSFLFFFRRIFVGKTFSIISWALIGLTTSWIVATFIANFTVGASVVVQIWKGNPAQTLSQTYALLRFIGGMAITSFVLDLLILSVPFPWIWRLQMPLAQKIGVSSVFLCGVFIVIAGAIRMVNGVEAMNYKMGDYADIFGLKARGDLLGWPAVWLFWSYVENGTGMIVCCLPCIKPLLNGRSVNRVAERLSSLASIRSLLSSKTYGEKSDNFSERQSTTQSSEMSSEQEKGMSHIKVTNTVDQYTIPITR